MVSRADFFRWGAPSSAWALLAYGVPLPWMLAPLVRGMNVPPWAAMAVLFGCWWLLDSVWRIRAGRRRPVDSWRPALGARLVIRGVARHVAVDPPRGS